jgi:biopolymer transport protein TolQ
MFVNPLLLATNPFIDAFTQSDFLGKSIFIALICCSLCSWVLLIQKTWLTYRTKKEAAVFYQHFESQKGTPLGIDFVGSEIHNPFYRLYGVLKKHTVEILNKNRQFGSPVNGVSYLTPADLDYVDSHLHTTISSQTQFLEKNLYILATIVSLAPFLGLLGTVWGILTTFSEMQTQASGGTQQMVLGGLSLALATTVLGLVDAIPALIGYNYLKNTIREIQTEMESFSIEILTAVERQYRKVETHE